MPLPGTADVWCTGPLRTAYDLGRRGDLVDRVVSVDRLDLAWPDRTSWPS